VLGRRVDVESDAVEVDGVRVGVAPDLIYYLLNKPKGVVTTAADTHDREIVTELVPDEPREYPVGRLDLDTEGLLLITNDGDLTHRLTHPSFGIEKEYLVEVDKPVSRGDLRRLREGVELDDGMTAPAKAQQVAPSVIKLTIHEGRNRQIRRMCSALGFTVTRLVRIRIGALADRNMAPGEWRELTLDEIRRLEELTALAGREAR
jgi:23S rRNA pseudouridine2605 synthase